VVALSILSYEVQWIELVYPDHDIKGVILFTLPILSGPKPQVSRNDTIVASWLLGRGFYDCLVIDSKF
jgi:hypothetical protein